MGQNFQKRGKISQHFWRSFVLTTSFPGEKYQFHLHPSFSATPLLIIQTHADLFVKITAVLTNTAHINP